MKKIIILAIAAVSFTACIKEVEPVLEIPSDIKKIMFSAKRERVIIPIKHNCPVTAFRDNSWYSVSNQGDSLIVSVEKNRGAEGRKGVLTIGAIGVKDTYEIEIEQGTGEYNTVYIAGHYSNGSKTLAALWKDGEIIRLSKVESEAKTVYLHDGDVYVAGQEDSTAVVWKNGEKLYELPTLVRSANHHRHRAYVTSMYVRSKYENGRNNTEVYVCGYQYYLNGGDRTNSKFPMLWKNGEAQTLDNSYATAAANSVFVNGNDVCVAGYYYDGHYRVCCWVNGQYNYSILDYDYNYNSIANSVYGSYIVGSYRDNYPVVWTIRTDGSDGSRYILNTDSKSGTAYAVFYNRGAVTYVAGSSVFDDNQSHATLWVGGVRQQLSDVSGSSATSVFVTDDYVEDGLSYLGDVYVAGVEGNTYVVWENGEKQIIDNGFRFSYSDCYRVLYVD